MAKGLLIIRTLTPSHPGAGTFTGAIDLMLQREVTTGFPFIQGSSLKGALRAYLEAQPVENKDLAQKLIDYAKKNGDETVKKRVENLTGDKMRIFEARKIVQILEKNKEKAEEVKELKSLYAKLDKVFGPYNPQGAFEKGALVITDASLLFYPVRSLKGLFAWVTCPEILRRLAMPHIGLNIPSELLSFDEKGKVLKYENNKNEYVINGRVYFEDLNFTVKTIDNDKFNWLENLRFKNIDFKSNIKDRLFIVHNDVFQYFVEFATLVISRNKIHYETGIVEKGALWTEEHLPPESYLFSYLEDDGKEVGKIDIKKSNQNKKKKVTSLEWLKHKLNSKVIHLGGDETVGKGFVELSFANLEEKQNG